MSISEHEKFVFEQNVICRFIWPLPLHIPSLGFQYHNTSDLTAGQFVLLQVFDPLHIRPLGFQYHDISNLASVQIVVLRLSPPSISGETSILLYRFFVHIRQVISTDTSLENLPLFVI